MERYPLTWPVGQPRCSRRRDADFKVEFTQARDELLNSLKLLGAKHVILSSSVPLRQDGLPYSGMAEPLDPGVAVYFDRVVDEQTRAFVIACDTYRKVRWNLRAVGATVEALRSIQRHGASSMLEQAFTGFAALPPKPTETDWWDVLGISQYATEREITEVYRLLAPENHPDRGGDPARMVAINQAYALARAGRDRGPAGG